MKTATTALVAIVALATSSIACSSATSQSKEEVDTGSALADLQSPTGSFSEENAGKAFGGYRGTKADTAKVSAPATGSGGVKTGSRTIKLLDAASGSGASQGQSQSCPNGGSMSYTSESSADGQLVKVTFSACGFEDGYGFDGKAILLASTKSLLGLSGEKAEKASPPAKPSKSGPSDDDFGSSDNGLQEAEEPAFGGGQYVALLLAAKGTVSNGKQKLPLSFALLTEASYAFLAVSVPDGKIVIGVSDDGRAIVKSKEGTWRCQSSSKGWTCTSDKGKSMEVKEEAPSEPSSASSDESGDEPSDPSEPSAPSPPAGRKDG